MAGADPTDLSDAEARVFQAVSELETEGEPTYKKRIADRSGLSVAELEPALSNLLTNRELVQELRGTDEPDLGPRYQLVRKD